MKKKFLAIFLVILLAVTSLSVCYADVISDLTGINIGNYEETIDKSMSAFNTGTEEIDDFWNGLEAIGEGAIGLLKLLIDLFSAILTFCVNAILKIVLLLFPSMDDIIFNELTPWGSFLRLSYFDSSPVGFAAHLVELVSAVYQIFRYIALIGFIVGIAVIAMKMILASVGKQKAQYKESLKNWLVGLVLLVVGHWIMIYSIYFSDFLVSVINETRDSIGRWGTTFEQPEDFSEGVENISDGLEAASKGGEFDLTSNFSAAISRAQVTTMAIAIPLSATGVGALLLIIFLLVLIVALVIFITMNMKVAKVYLERVIVVGVLIMIFPIITVFYVFEKSGIKKGSTFESWLRTFMEQVFIQPVHALSLLGVCIALDALNDTFVINIPIVGTIIMLMVLNTMFTIENIIKRVFAISGPALGSPINPTAPVAAAANAVAPAIGHGARAGMSSFSSAFRKGGMNGKSFISALGGAFKDGSKSALRFGMTGSNRGRAISALLGGAGINVPQGLFDSKMSMLEQKNGAKMMRKIAIKGVPSEAGDRVATWDTMHKMLNHNDPDLVTNAFKKTNLTQGKLRDIMLNGNGTPEEKNAARAFALAMSDPTIDLDKLKGADGNFESTILDNLEYSDNNYAKAATASRKMGNSGTPDDSVVTARKMYAFNKPSEATRIKGEVGLDDEIIAGIEAGHSTIFREDGTAYAITSNDRLAYRAMIEGMADPKLDMDKLKTSGKFDVEILDNLDYSDRDYTDGAIHSRSMSSSTVPDYATRTARKMYAYNNPQRAQKIMIEVGLDQDKVDAIESGTNTNADDILSYKIMMERYADPKLGMSDFQETNGAGASVISTAMYEGVTMDSSTRMSNARTLMTVNITDSANSQLGRSTLESFRRGDKDKLYQAATTSGIDINALDDFIDRGTTTGIDDGQFKLLFNKLVWRK